jgi:phosphoketolase
MRPVALVISQRDTNAIIIAGPGHGGPAVVASTYLEGTYSEIYPAVSQDEEGLARLFHQFSLPGGIPSHAAPETPGSIHEGGELGYSLSHAFGAAFDNPDLLVACVIGDGEAETGPLAASRHSNKFLDPVTGQPPLGDETGRGEPSADKFGKCPDRFRARARRPGAVGRQQRPALANSTARR